MFKFENPLDPSKDGQNPLIDGIRYNIRNSESIKEEIMNNSDKVMAIIDLYQNAYDTYLHPTQALDLILQKFGYDADDLIIADEHELLEWIYKFVD